MTLIFMRLIFPHLSWVSTGENFRCFSIGPSFLVYEYSKDADSTKYEILEVTRISSHLISPNKVHISAIKYKKAAFSFLMTFNTLF